MKNKITRLLLLTIAFLLSQLQIQAQSIVNTASHTSVNSSMQHCYSIGEMAVVHTTFNNNIIVTQGFLQPSEEKIDSHSIQDVQVVVYPNPTNNIVFVEINSIVSNEMSILLFDGLGKLLSTQEINCATGISKIPVSLEAYVSGNYFVKVQNTKHQTVNNFKIQKIN